MTLCKSQGGGRGRYTESARTAEELKSVTVQRVFKVFALFSSPAWQVRRRGGTGEKLLASVEHERKGEGAHLLPLALCARDSRFTLANTSPFRPGYCTLNP